VGTWENKEQGYCCAALNLVTGQLTTRVLEQPAPSQAKTGQSKQQRLQMVLAAHLRDIARAYPASAHVKAVSTIDNALASWGTDGSSVGGPSPSAFVSVAEL
jgi:hypothetical protein